MGRKALLLTCPHCSHEQAEPHAVLSTYCRKCSKHYQVVKGLPVAAGRPALHPIEDIVSTKSPDRLSAIPATNKKSASEQEVTSTRGAGFSFKPNGTTTTLCDRDTDIECIDCGHLHSVSEQSASSLCPRCGSYTSLQHYDIREAWTRQIRTRGNVHIHSNGQLTDTSVTCRNLTIEGEFNGTVDCSGELVIRRSCHILGSIRCHRLVVENQAVVTCASGIHAKEVVVDGSVEADISCEGRLELARKATLRGDINISKLIINEGAAHQGRVSMVSPLSR